MHVGVLVPFSPPAEARAATSSGRSSRSCGARPRRYPPWNLKLRHPELLASPLQAWVEDERLRPRLPRAPLGAAVARRRARARHPRVAPAQQHDRFPPPALGGALHRGARGRAIRHLLQGAPRARRRVHGHAPPRAQPVDRSRPTATRRCSSPRRRERERPRAEDAPRRRSIIAAPRCSATRSARPGTSGARSMNVAARDARARPRPWSRRCRRRDRCSTGRSRATGASRRSSFDVERLRRIAQRAGRHAQRRACSRSASAALRRFLLEQDALPEEPLTAMLPVNIRPKGDPGGGNAVGAILASLATDVADPVRAPARHRGLDPAREGAARRACRRAPSCSTARCSCSRRCSCRRSRAPPGACGRRSTSSSPTCPVPSEPLYFRGWRLEALYPLSIPFHGYALNITVASYAGDARLRLHRLPRRRPAPAAPRRLRRRGVRGAEITVRDLRSQTVVHSGPSSGFARRCPERWSRGVLRT